MIKGFLADVYICNDETGIGKDASKMFDDVVDAHEYLDRVKENLGGNERITFCKVYPIVECACGEKVYCSSFTNTCDKCNADYNFNGSLLAPRDQWGEETGETWWECY